MVLEDVSLKTVYPEFNSRHVLNIGATEQVPRPSVDITD